MLNKNGWVLPFFTFLEPVREKLKNTVTWITLITLITLYIIFLELSQKGMRIRLVSIKLRTLVFSCPQQLNRTHCLSLGWSGTTNNQRVSQHYRVTLETCDL